MRWLALLLLAGCAAQEEVTYRNEAKPLGGTARFNMARFAGEWRAAACIGPCAPQEKYFAPSDEVVMRTTSVGTKEYILERAGVLRLQGKRDRIVVMWVDEGFRTAAIGDADGRWAAIIERGEGAADRRTAAREMLRFNGYQTSLLREF